MRSFLVVFFVELFVLFIACQSAWPTYHGRGSCFVCQQCNRWTYCQLTAHR